MSNQENNSPDNVLSGDNLSIYLIDITDLLYEYRKIIISTTIIFTILAMLYAFSLPRFYQSSILIMPNGQSTQQVSGLSGLLGEALGSGGGGTIGISSQSDPDIALAILQSRQFIEMYIEENNLQSMILPEFWDEKQKQWNDPDGLFMAYDLVQSAIEVSFNKTLITLKYTWIDPEIAANLANQMISKLNEYIRQAAIIEGRESMLFLENELINTPLASSKAMLFRLMEQQTQNITLANVREEYAFKVIDPAVAPIFPAGPKRKLITFIGGVFGIFFGLFLSLTIHFVKTNELIKFRLKNIFSKQ